MPPTLRRKPCINDFHLPSYSVLPLFGEVQLSENIAPPPSYTNPEPTSTTMNTRRMGYIQLPDAPENEDHSSLHLSPVDDISLDDFTFEVQPSTIHEDPTLRRILEQSQSRRLFPSLHPTSSRSASPPLLPAPTISSTVLPSLNEFRSQLNAPVPPPQGILPSIHPPSPHPYCLEVTPPRHVFAPALGYLRERGQGNIHPLIELLPSNRPNRIIDESLKQQVPGYAFVNPTPTFRVHRHIVSLVDAHVCDIRYAHEYEGVAHVVNCHRQFIEKNWAVVSLDDEPQIPIGDDVRISLKQTLLDLAVSPEEDRKVKISAR